MLSQEQFYKTLCEQLAQQIQLLEKKVAKAKEEKAKKSKKADKDYDGDGEIESGKEEYFGSRDKAIKKNMAKKKGIVDKNKKKKLDEGRVIGGGHFQYGGFPRVLNENAEMGAEIEKHLRALTSHGQNLHKTDHPNRRKFGEALIGFTKGNYNNADELIRMGADPTAVGKYIAIATNPEYQEYMKNAGANADPTLGGLYSSD
jgi:hypothetical protein